MEDAQLATWAAAGDRAAWSDIYDSYADRLHDFCWSVLRDREAAAGALHDTFVSAARRIGQLRNPALLRPWLYSICRSQVLGRRRTGAVAGTASPAVGADASEYRVRELRQLVWHAVGELAPRDRALLELHLRHGLEGPELAYAIGANEQQAAAQLNTIGQDAERALYAMLIARTGRGGCEQLNTLLAEWDGTLSPLLRKQVTKHVDTCEACGLRRRQLLSPLALLSGVPLEPAPDGLRDRVLDDIAPLLTRDGGHGTRLADIGNPPEGALARRYHTALRMGRGGLTAAAAVVAVIALLSAVLIAATRREEPMNVGGIAVGATLDTTTASPTTTTSAPTTTPPPTSSSPTATPTRATMDLQTKQIDFGATATTTVLQFRNAGGRAMPWMLTSNQRAVTVKPSSGTLAPGATATVNVSLDRSKVPEGDFTSQLRLSGAGTNLIAVTAVENQPPGIRDLVVAPAWLVAAPSGCTTARVSATVADKSPVTVILSWQQGGGPVTDLPMSGSNGRFTTRIGPPAAATGDIRWWIVATDQRGNVGRSTDRVLEVRSTGSTCPP